MIDFDKFSEDIKRLANMTREKEKQFNFCDHNLEIQGFSIIAHLNDAVLKGFLCSLCGIRLSYEEGTEYVDRQRLIEMKRLERLKYIEYYKNGR